MTWVLAIISKIRRERWRMKVVVVRTSSKATSSTMIIKKQKMRKISWERGRGRLKTQMRKSSRHMMPTATVTTAMMNLNQQRGRTQRTVSGTSPRNGYITWKAAFLSLVPCTRTYSLTRKKASSGSHSSIVRERAASSVMIWDSVRPSR